MDTNGAQLTTFDAVKTFILAGNATFTLRSKSTGNRYTFKARKAEKNSAYFVSLLRGSDNENDYCYMGVIQEDLHFRFTRGSTVKPDAPSSKAFVWFWDRVMTAHRVPETCEVWHEGRCGRCGRKLTVPESLAIGLGPECAESSF